MRVWRISNHADLSGLGGLRAAGRWNRKGTPIVYCSDHPATALIEILVHFDREDLPETYQLLEIDLPDALLAPPPRLPANWREAADETRAVFENFVKEGRAAALPVPSALVPAARNILLNPAHRDFHRIRISGARRHFLDRRFTG